MNELIGNCIILLGAFFVFIAAVGVLKFSTLFLKMHAATKAGTLGSGLILLGVGIQIKDLHGLTEIILLILFIAITNPISAHLIAKVANLQDR